MDESRLHLFTDEEGELFLSEDYFVVEAFSPSRGVWVEVSKPYVVPIVGNTISLERMLSMTNGVKPNVLNNHSINLLINVALVSMFFFNTNKGPKISGICRAIIKLKRFQFVICSLLY